MRVARPPSGSVAVGPLVPFTGLEWQGGHFVAHGFSPGDDVDSLARRAGDADEIVFRVAPDAAVWESVAQAAELVAGHGFRAVINVQLPRREEGRMFDDDVLVANRVVEAEVAARAFRDTTVFIDGFIDHDRGYYPRVGLLDRRGDPRGGLRALVAFASTVSSGSNWRLVDVDASARYFEGDHQGLLLVEGEIRAPAGRVVSLLDGRPGGAQLQPGPWLVMDSFQP